MYQNLSLVFIDRAVQFAFDFEEPAQINYSFFSQGAIEIIPTSHSANVLRFLQKRLQPTYPYWAIIVVR